LPYLTFKLSNTHKEGEVKKTLFLMLILLSYSSFAFIDIDETISGVKFPNQDDVDDGPVYTTAKVLSDYSIGYSDLLPYVFPSPNQEDAGSCLYMATTGNIEWWMAKLNPKTNRMMNGPLDISERFLMNIAGKKEYTQEIKNWRTDSVYLANHPQGLILNQVYPYTKGWYKRVDGKKVPAEAYEDGADYGTIYNWINEIPQFKGGAFIKTPYFQRNIIYADPENNQWNVGVTPDNIVETVKKKLTENKAPVLVMYNHYGYWHVHMIVGFDDEADTNSCSFTKGTIPFMAKKAQKYHLMAEEETDPEKKEKLEAKAKRYTKLSQKLDGIFDKIGGCKGKGAFYVRDSLYSSKEDQNYDYGTSDPNDDRNYSKKVILREYEYLNVLSNHIIQIMPL